MDSLPHARHFFFRDELREEGSHCTARSPLFTRGRLYARHAMPNTVTRCQSQSSWRIRQQRARAPPSPHRSPSPLTDAPLETALRAIATSAAYDLRKEDGAAPVLPMLWHYQMVAVHELPRVHARWPDGSAGQAYTPIVLDAANERLSHAYADEMDLVAPLAPQ